MASFDYAFPATDSRVVQQLQTPLGSAQRQTIIDGINAAETANLFQSLNAAEQNSNTGLTYGAYLSRNLSLRNVAEDMRKENERVNNGAKETYTRQSEINEWAAQNKMDTLFFLQVLFIYFSIIVVCLFLRQSGLLPNAVLYIVAGIGLLIILGILWNRASYTTNSRDKRYWNRRYLGLDDAGLSAKLQCTLE